MSTENTREVYLDYMLFLCILVYNQDTFPLRFHSSRPDSSEDTPENSSSRSSLVTDNLINGKNHYDQRTQKMFLRGTL